MKPEPFLNTKGIYSLDKQITANYRNIIVTKPIISSIGELFFIST